MCASGSGHVAAVYGARPGLVGRHLTGFCVERILMKLLQAVYSTLQENLAAASVKAHHASVVWRILSL
jgi:hypothetical protein